MSCCVVTSVFFSNILYGYDEYDTPCCCTIIKYSQFLFLFTRRFYLSRFHSRFLPFPQFYQRKSKHFESRTTANRLYLYQVFNFLVDCFQVSINNYMHNQSFVGFPCQITKNFYVFFGNRIKFK